MESLHQEIAIVLSVPSAVPSSSSTTPSVTPEAVGAGGITTERKKKGLTSRV